VKVITIGSNDDCVWNPSRCEIPKLSDNTSSQIIENAENILLSLGGNCPAVPGLSLEECIARSHSRVLIDSFVLNLIGQYVGSPTVP
jgi:hypothetical protein